MAMDADQRVVCVGISRTGGSLAWREESGYDMDACGSELVMHGDMVED